MDLLSDDIRHFSAMEQTGVSLRTITQTGRGEFVQLDSDADDTNATLRTQKMLMQVAMFLHRELPIRLAHRVRDLDSIPHLSGLQGTKAVRTMYARSFEEIRAAPTPNTLARERYFAELLQSIYSRHSSVLLMMARSAYQLRGKMDEVDFAEQEEIHAFLDSFYMSRIGIRMLIGQYLALREETTGSGYVGLVQQHTSPADVAMAAMEDAKFMCKRSYGDAPEVTMHGRTDLTFQYVPTHLHYILMELLKNSMRATAEYHMGDQTGDNGSSTKKMPPIRVVIADGERNEDVVIKVSDEGGGVSRSHMTKVWSYLFTTADPSVQAGAIGEGESDFDTGSPLAGLGYGLPISRAYARYFGGDLSIMSMEGYGTDAFVHLSRLGNHDEPLP